jgi:hypothetical protein
MMKTTTIISALLLLASCSSPVDDIIEAHEAIEENYRISEEEAYQRGQEKLKELEEAASGDPYKFVPASDTL